MGNINKRYKCYSSALSYLTNVVGFKHPADSYSGPPHILFNTSQSNPQEGMPFILQCLTAPDPTATIKWLRGEQELQSSNGITLTESHEVVFETFATTDTGNYTCAMMDGKEIVLHATINLQFFGLSLAVK